MIAGHGNESQVAGVGEIEVEPGVSGIGERGFTVRGGRESQLARGKVEVAAEDIAQCAVGDNEASAVFREAESRSAGLLIRRECVGKTLRVT